MFIIQEDLQTADRFKLVTSALDRLVVIDAQANSQCIDLPKLPAAEQDDKVGQIKPTEAVINRITCMESSRDQQYIAVTTESKQLVVFGAHFGVVKNLILARAPSKVCFTPTNDVLVADRTGDVYLYKIADESNQPQLLLGHLSVILDMLVTTCGQYVITCDRDEKIRVSRYPNSYNIATFCLGHTEFVTSLALLTNPNVLLSASGDGTVRMWHYSEGKQISIINTAGLVDGLTMEKFGSQMDLEKVDVTALPVTSMKVSEQNGLVTLAISLYSIPKLYLYSIKTPSLEHSLKHTVDLYANIVSYWLTSRLYVLSDKFEVYQVDADTLRAVDAKTTQNRLVEYKAAFVSNDCDVTAWYKRKFDNVQEYMERKKLRLESK
ncbi:tRNA (guanine-N(7)-)-methyltransferase non-catalytic subunit wuho-like [Dendroctonus ponderosae]